jgi:hypothetical protein
MSYANPPPQSPARSFHRPLLVALLAIIVAFVGAIVLIAGLLLALGLGLIGGALFGTAGAVFGAALGLIVALIGGVTLSAGLGLWHLRSWAWWLASFVVVVDLVFAGLYGKIALGALLLYLIIVKKHFR